MGVQKIRRALAVSGPIYLGSGADVGIERSAAGTLRLLGSNDAAPGTIDSPAILAPTFSGAGAGILDMVAGEIRTGTVDGALTNANMGTAKPGRLIIGQNGATIQFGFVHKGTAFIFSALAGTGAVSSVLGA